MGCSGHQKSESFKHSFRVSLGETLAWVGTKFTIMICDFVCNMCGKQFKSQKTLTQHIRDVHIEEDIPCSLCEKTFRTKKHLANHKFSKHKEKESLQCDECSYNTKSGGNLKAHKKRVHEKISVWNKIKMMKRLEEINGHEFVLW